MTSTTENVYEPDAVTATETIEQPPAVPSGHSLHVAAAIADIRVAAAILRNAGHAVLGVDLRGLSGCAKNYAASDQDADRYFAAVDAALTRLPGLSMHGYQLRRVPIAARPVPADDTAANDMAAERGARGASA